MEGISATINAIWNFVNTTFEHGAIAFSLFDVFCAGLILSLIGYFIGKIVLFINNRR